MAYNPSVPELFAPINASPAWGPFRQSHQEAIQAQREKEQQQALEMFAQQQRIMAEQQMKLAQFQASLNAPKSSIASRGGGRAGNWSPPPVDQRPQMSTPYRNPGYQPYIPNIVGPSSSSSSKYDVSMPKDDRDYMAELQAKIKAEKELAAYRAQLEKQMQAQAHKHNMSQIALQKQAVREDVLSSLIGNLLR